MGIYTVGLFYLLRAYSEVGFFGVGVIVRLLFLLFLGGLDFWGGGVFVVRWRAWKRDVVNSFKTFFWVC